MKHVCIPNSFDLTWGYNGLQYQADSCGTPLQTSDFSNIISDCDSGVNVDAYFRSTSGRIAQFWTVELELSDIIVEGGSGGEGGSGVDEDEAGSSTVIASVPIEGSSFKLKWRYRCDDYAGCISDANDYEIDFDTGEPVIHETRIFIDTYDTESEYYNEATFSFGFTGNTFHTTGGSTGIFYIDGQAVYSPDTSPIPFYNFVLLYDNPDAGWSFNDAAALGQVHTMEEAENLLSRATLNKDGSYRSGYSADDTDGYYTIEYNDLETQLDGGGKLSIFRNPPSENVVVGTTYVGDFNDNGTIEGGVYTKWDGSTGEFNAQLKKCNGSAYECQKDNYPVIPQNFDLRFETESGGDASPLDNDFYDCGNAFNYTKSEITINEDGTFITGGDQESTFNLGGRVRKSYKNRKDRKKLPPKPTDETNVSRERGVGTYEFDLENGTMTLYYSGNDNDGEVVRTEAISVIEDYPFKFGIARGSYRKWDGNVGTFHTNPLVFERTQVGSYDRIGGSSNDDGDYYITVHRYYEDDTFGKVGSMCLHRSPTGNQNGILCQPILGNYTGLNSGATSYDKGIAYKYPVNGLSEHFTWYHHSAFNNEESSCECSVDIPDWFNDIYMGLQLNCLDIEWIVQFSLPYQYDTEVSGNDPAGTISNTYMDCCIEDHYTYSDETVGCTNPYATNFDCWATADNGSCSILGCTSPDADNYNPDATIDDDTCVFSGEYSGRILISEFGQDFHSYGAQQMGDLNFQYVELYNSLPFAVNISGWTLNGQKWYEDSTNVDATDGLYYFEDCPELFVGFEGTAGNCCTLTSEQPMYTFPEGTTIYPNDFILLVTNDKSWKPVCTDDQLFENFGLCWDGNFCYPDLKHVYPNGINVIEDLNGDGENDLQPGNWYNTSGQIRTGLGRLNEQTTFSAYGQAELGFPAYYNGSQTMLDYGNVTRGSADCTGQESPEWREVERVYEECMANTYSIDNTTMEYWETMLACDNAHYSGLNTTPKWNNYHGPVCNYDIYTPGTYSDYQIPSWVNVQDCPNEVDGTCVLQGAALDQVDACNNHPACLDYYQAGGAGGCVQGPPGGYNIVDNLCHPSYTAGSNTCCPDGAYYDDDPWDSGDTYGGENGGQSHGYRLQRCISHWGEDLTKFRIYDGTNASVANLFQWDRSYTLDYPSLHGTCPEKLSLIDNIGNVVIEMGNERFGIEISPGDFDADGLGTHLNSHGPGSTELQIPLNVDWNTFNPNDKNNWNFGVYDGYGMGTIFYFENGFNGDGTVIQGCMDMNASNYNPLATEDDGTCTYDEGNFSELHLYFCDAFYVQHDPCFNCDGELTAGAADCVWDPDSNIINSNCDAVSFKPQQAVHFLHNYYMFYYNLQTSWKDAWEMAESSGNGSYGEYVPYYQGQRECGPRIVQLPASSFPSICSDQSSELCDASYDAAYGGFNYFATVVKNMGGTCGECSPGETCRISLEDSYCVSSRGRREDGNISHIGGRKYTTTRTELEIIIRNPNRETVIDGNITPVGTHEEDIE